jgi:putative spermidine/putrescine transport system substrate-binding protein
MSRRTKRGALWAAFAALVVALAFAAAGCGGDDNGGDSSSAMLEEVGQGEGRVDLIAWAGYVEDGSTDPKVDWVTSFEEETGCQVNAKVANTSD